MIEKIKPAFLYHGSSCQNISVLEPRCLTTRKLNEGAVIFATPSYALASCFTFPWNGSWATIISIDEMHYFIANSEKRLKDSDNPCSIYHVNTDSFDYDDDKGMGYYEWIAYNEQKPVREDQFLSAIENMHAHGIQFVFLPGADFETFMNMPYDQRKRKILSL